MFNTDLFRWKRRFFNKSRPSDGKNALWKRKTPLLNRRGLSLSLSISPPLPCGTAGPRGPTGDHTGATVRTRHPHGGQPRPGRQPLCCSEHKKTFSETKEVLFQKTLLHLKRSASETFQNTFFQLKHPFVRRNVAFTSKTSFHLTTDL